MIAGGGFAMMAWQLAQLRAYGRVPGFHEGCSNRKGLAGRQYASILSRAQFWWDYWKDRKPGKGSFPIFL